MSNKVVCFSYENNPVGFYNKDGMLFVNATEMAKPFGRNKRPSNWLRTQPAIDYINEVAVAHICATADLQRVTQGVDKEQGTWLQEDVALEFARWLSPKFGVWCNDRIKELVRQGYTTMPNINNLSLDALGEYMIVCGQKMKELKEAKRIINLQQIQLKEQEKYVDYTQKILACPDTVSVSQIAQDYGYSAVALNKMLCDWNVQYKQNGIYLLYAKYKDCGYVQSETLYVNDTNSSKQFAHVYTKWTQKGRMFLYELLKSKGILPVVEKNKQQEQLNNAPTSLIN